jgi:hypothetical protein
MCVTKLALNSKKIKTKFNLIEFYDQKINHMRLFGLQSSNQVLNSHSMSSEVGNYNFLSSFINTSPRK